MAWIGGGRNGGCDRRGFLICLGTDFGRMFTSLPATWSRGELDSGGLLSISSLLMCLILIGFRSSFWFVFFNNLLFLATGRVKKTMFVACIFNADLTIRLANLI